MVAAFAVLAIPTECPAAEDAPPRARDLGIPFDGIPGHANAITDVAGVTVGHVTLVEDLPDNAAIRTGVTAILPRGSNSLTDIVFGAWFALNGNGEMTGTAWLDESGYLEGPILLTNTHSVGVVHDAAIEWRVRNGDADTSGYWWSLPIVAETWDGQLNDINGFHVSKEHVFQALETAAGGTVAEGSVGGGTGMICHDFKCGIGTSSRVVGSGEGSHMVGVLVQANYGVRETLRIVGVPVGEHMPDRQILNQNGPDSGEAGSIIIVVATDAPLLPHQLKRLCKRASLGLARNGSYAGNGSGDIFICFSTRRIDVDSSERSIPVTMMLNRAMDPYFRATVEATEEAIVNAMIAARDMTGHMGRHVQAIDHKALQEVLARYGRLGPSEHRVADDQGIQHD